MYISHTRTLYEAFFPLHSMLSFKKTHFSAFFAEPLVFLAFERTLGRFLKIGPLPCRSSATLVFLKN